MRPQRRVLVAAGLLAPLARGRAQGSPRETGMTTTSDATMAALLLERLRHEGVGLVAARFGASGPVALAAAQRPGAAAVSAEDQRFEIGSITKVFVGVLLAEAVRRGEVALADAVEDGLDHPLRDGRGQPLRLVDLATHRSGLPRLPPNLRPAREADPYVDYGEAALREALRDWRPTRGRDEAFEYSNFAFGLLGWLLARRAGLPFEQLVAQRLFEPLGLRVDETLALAPGHDAQGRPVPAWGFSAATAGAGALRLSAAQLARFGQVVLGRGGHPLREALTLSLQTHSPLGPGPGVAMGLGWMLLSGPDGPLATHDGGTAGASSSLWLALAQGRGGLVLANAAVPVTDLARHLVDTRSPLRDLAAEQRQAQLPAAVVGAAALAPLAGVYAVSPQFAIVVRARGGQLFAQASGQGEFELFARDARRFFARVAVLELVFEGADGVPPALVLHQGGQQIRFVRTGDEPAARVLPPAALLPLVGVYALNPAFRLTLRAEGSRLFAQATGQAEFELFAQGDRSFVARVAALSLRFEAGDPSPALWLTQAGRELRFVRE